VTLRIRSPFAGICLIISQEVNLFSSERSGSMICEFRGVCLFSGVLYVSSRSLSYVDATPLSQPRTVQRKQSSYTPPRRLRTMNLQYGQYI